MGLLSPKIVVLGILSGYPATEVDLLIPSGRKAVQVRALPPAPDTIDDFLRSVDLRMRLA
jgi:hypothetical protein